MKIDHNQMNAIRHKDGPALILAGPGSGKTTVITRRTQFLIEEYGIAPSKILVITFSRAAANEMKQRFVRLMGGKNLPVTFGTFHAVFFQILKHAYGYQAGQVISDEKRVQFIREFIHRLRLEYDNENDFIRDVLGEISVVKNESVELEHYYATSCAGEVFRKICRAYQEFMYRNHYIDFDDMLVYTKELFEKRPDIRRLWQKRFPYILVDEFQDINRIQYDIMRMMAAPLNNLFVVGDDDQSIYQFRGARPEIMLGFEKDYPEARQIPLSVNYRCGKQITAFAGNLIAHNHTRFPKEITANSTSDLPVLLWDFPTQREQNRALISEILRLHREEGIAFHRMAVLFRTNAQPGLLIQQLFEFNIPFLSRDHIPNLYDHWIAGDLFTYIRLAGGDRSRAAFLKIMNRPNRYLSRESLPGETVDFYAWKNYYKKQDWIARRLEKLQIDLNVLAGMRPYSAINYIRKAIAYEDFLKDFSDFRKIPLDDLMDILDEIQEDAKEFNTYTDWLAHIDQVKEEWKKQNDEADREKDSVLLTTFHSAKGLEFDTVFIIDVNENVMPYKKALLDQEIEEERRMFYVGMTRAIRRLYLLHSGKIRNKEMEPSRFLSECLGQ